MGTEPEKMLKALKELERDQVRSEDRGRRAFERVPLRGEAELIAIDQTRPMPAIPIQLRDVGWGGFGFICQAELKANSQWRAIFYRQSQQIAQQTLAVRYCERVAGDLWLVGAQVCVEAGVVDLLGAERLRIAG